VKAAPGGRIFALKVAEVKLLSHLILAIFFATALHAQQNRSCKDDPKIVGQCFKIHGRVRIGNGIGMTIWRIGTDRILAVGDVDIIIPRNLSDAFGKDNTYDRDVFGNFEVCPLTKSKEGEMQWVCVESASRLVVRERK
jgi:hypothetical protein